MKVVDGYKTETNATAFNYAGDDDDYIIALDPTESALIRDSRNNAVKFNEVMKERYAVADKIIKETQDLGPEEPVVNKLKLNEEWFKDYKIQ